VRRPPRPAPHQPDGERRVADEERRERGAERDVQTRAVVTEPGGRRDDDTLGCTGLDEFPRSPRPSNGAVVRRPGEPAGTSHSVIGPAAVTGRLDQT
jgi:hypothetical protein